MKGNKTMKQIIQTLGLLGSIVLLIGCNENPSTQANKTSLLKSPKEATLTNAAAQEKQPTTRPTKKQAKQKANPFYTPRWYFYYYKTHEIISNRHLYAVKTDKDQYKFMIIKHINAGKKKPSSSITFTYQALGGKFKTVTITQASQGEIDKNPDLKKNYYAYFDLDSEEQVYLTDAQAKNSKDWTIAFYIKAAGIMSFMAKSELRANSGKSGPGKIKIAMAKKNADGQDQTPAQIYRERRNIKASKAQLNARKKIEAMDIKAIFDSIEDFDDIKF